MRRRRKRVLQKVTAEKVLAQPRVRRPPHIAATLADQQAPPSDERSLDFRTNTLSTIMYSNRQLAYAPTPYIPRSTLSATINLDEVRTTFRELSRMPDADSLVLGSQAIHDERRTRLVRLARRDI